MNKHLRKFLITGASLLMFVGVGAGINNVVKPAHADMPAPEFFHSTKHKDNVYYLMNSPYDHGRKYRSHYIYTRMPKLMRRRNHIFALYYGRKFYKEYGTPNNGQPEAKLLHRNGKTYLPDYVGYINYNYNVSFHGYKHGNILMVYVNKRDIGKPVKNQNKAYHGFTSMKQLGAHVEPIHHKKIHKHPKKVTHKKKSGHHHFVVHFRRIK